jgi:alkylglycerol monooxygenase
MTELQMLAVAYVFFLALIGVELRWSVSRGDGGYRLGEAVVNIGHGVVYQVFDFLTKSVVVVPFLLLGGLVSWQLLPSDAWWGWLVGLVLYDFCSYWAHRHHHEIHALWAIHGVHHAAEDFNLAAALRQPAFQRLTAWPWRLPLVLVIPGEMFVGLVVFDFVYQFVQHTRYVPKLGPIGWWMNTPSHHRVHHGRDEAYLDKNYGGILIIWDRLFGTFQPEQHEPSYGLTKPIRSLDAVWGNLAIGADLAAATKTVRGWSRAKVWWSGPADLEAVAPHHASAPAGPAHDDRSVPAGLRAFVVIHGLAIPPVLGWMVMVGDAWSWAPRLALSAWIVLAVTSLGGLLQRRRWAVPLQGMLIAAASCAASMWWASAWPLLPGALALGWVGSHRERSPAVRAPHHTKAKLNRLGSGTRHAP